MVVIPKHGRKVAPSYSTPWFCTKCEQIRGVPEDEATLLNTAPQGLSWNSFEMCTECYTFSQQYPDKVEENKKAFQERERQKAEAIKAKIERTVWRVCLEEENPRMPTGDYAKSISGLDFTKYPIETERGYVTKSRELVELDQAEQAVNILQNKGLSAWYESEKK